MNYDAMLNEIGEYLKTPMSAVKAYRCVLDNPKILRVLDKEKAKTLYAIVNLSQRECPRFYGESFAKKPDNGFLDYLFRENPNLDDGDKKEFVRAAESFTPAKMKEMQRNGGNPLEHVLNGPYVGRSDKRVNEKRGRSENRFALSADDEYYRSMQQHLGVPGIPSVVLVEEGC